MVPKHLGPPGSIPASTGSGAGRRIVIAIMSHTWAWCGRDYKAWPPTEFLSPPSSRLVHSECGVARLFLFFGCRHTHIHTCLHH
eukprot:superscaffoldBa00000102_g1487